MVQAVPDPRRAWEPYRPSADEPWNIKKAGHLFRRAGFGATLAELELAVREGPERTIDALLRDRPDTDGDEVWALLARGLAQQNNGQQLPAAWLYRMLYSPNALREKMTLFWHNHFATSNLKVRNASLMLGQYELLRRHALGNFRTLLQEMSLDPAMMIWLDTTLSRRGQPNENYARELMELFSLGINDPARPERRNYSEQDIREAARAFTGWALVEGRPKFVAGQHDDGEKNVLGQKGRWRSPDVVRICLDQPAAAFFITRKLFRFLVSETIVPTAELLEPLARSFRDSDYDFAALVARVLRSNLFFSAEVYRSRIKMPVEFVLEIVHGLEGHREGGSGRRLGTLELASAMDGLGQRLFHPPSVAGWEGGRAWLNGQTFLQRQNLALSLTSTLDDRFGRRLDPAELLRRHDARGDDKAVDLLLHIFLQADVSADSRTRLLDYLRGTHAGEPVYWTPEDAANHRLRAVCHLILSLPEFQLA